MRGKTTSKFVSVLLNFVPDSPYSWLSVADSPPKWQMVPWGGKTHVFWEGREPEEKQALAQERLPGKAGRRVRCGGSMGRPLLLLTTAGRESVPMGAESPACSEERRGRKRISGMSDILLGGWLCSLRGRGCASSASSKQSVQKIGRVFARLGYLRQS